TFFDPPLYPNGPPSWAGSLLESGQDASGFQYKRNRYYDPKTGRFTQEDPLGLAGGLNLYGFAGGDPVNFSDPFRLFCCTEEEARLIFVGTGRLLQPAQNWLEGWGRALLLILPCGGGAAVANLVWDD